MHEIGSLLIPTPASGTEVKPVTKDEQWRNLVRNFGEVFINMAVVVAALLLAVGVRSNCC